MLRLLIRALNRLSRELGWIHHYHQSYGLTSIQDVYQCIHGFAPKSYTAYDISRNSPDDYISEKLRFFGLSRVHGGHKIVAKDKSIFRAVLSQAGYGNHLPKRYKRFRVAETQHTHLNDGTYIIKPSQGSGGHGVIRVTSREGVIKLRRSQLQELRAYDDGSGYYLEEVIENSEYSARIFNDALNTIRILTIWDAGGDTPFIAAASHRFGTNESAPTDNASRGGIYCPIDLDTGRLDPAFVKHGTRKLSNEHPDTGATIAGVTVKRWHELKDFMVEVAATLSFCPLLGWDVVIDRADRFVIIEANPTPGMRLLQVHTPLLTDLRVRSFLKEYALI